MNCLILNKRNPASNYLMIQKTLFHEPVQIIRLQYLSNLTGQNQVLQLSAEHLHIYQ